MGMSTSIIGPYDALPTHDKERVMGGVPSVVHAELFKKLFTLRGAQDKIMARLFLIFHTELMRPEYQARLESAITIEDRETVANDILNAIAATVYKAHGTDTAAN